MYGQSLAFTDSEAPLSATLIALSMGQLCTQQLRSLRDGLWKATGDFSFLTLFPLIPLLWIQKGGRIPHTLRFPAVPPPIDIHLDCHQNEGSLFLPVEDPGQLSAIREILLEWNSQTAGSSLAQPIQSRPFAAERAAVYLGTDSPIARQHVLEFGTSMKDRWISIDDFRLVTIDVRSTSDWKHDLQYQVWQDRHLSRGGHGHTDAQTTAH
jgi:hypothetical protein